MPVKIADSSSWDSDYMEGFQFDDDMDWDIQLYDLPISEFYTTVEDNVGFIAQPTEINNPNVTANTTTQNAASLKYQIRNHDCMWSGRCVAHPEKSKCSYVNKNSSNNSSSNTQPQNQPQNTIYTNPNNNVIKLSSTQIPAGRSLLLNSRLNQSNNLINQCNNNNLNNNLKWVAKLPNITTTDFLKDRDRESNPTVIRPDTPISLDDDPPEFKHSIDLAACTMGSNKMSLVNPEEVSSARIITMLKEHLEDQSNDSNQIQKDLRTFLTHKPDSLSDLLQDLQEITDFEEDSVDEDSSRGSMYTSSRSETSRIASPQPTSKSEYQATHVGDHCYTRCKNRSESEYSRNKSRVNTDPLGVQTPSDSEEEIDVVSVGDKTLPTNPSARDRRALQTTVADKITARMVKTPRGIKTLPARRQIGSDDDSILSSCNSTPTKIGSPGGSTLNFSSSSSLQCTDVTTSSRKRTHAKESSSSGSSKRHRGKKQRSPKRQTSDSDEADTIEKRNLHNDMERQRRIGLKNLFEELKRQIPSIKDKERAPKVSILREAATLCIKLNREQEQYAALKKQQTKLMHKLKSLRMSLAPQYPC